MRPLIPLLVVGALALSTGAARADLGDQLFKVSPDDGAAGAAGLAMSAATGAEVDPDAMCTARSPAWGGGAAGSCPGAGDCCVANGSPGCDDPQCCTAICSLSPQCCLLDWTQFCADQAAADEVNCEQCQGCGAPAAGDCCSANGTPFCSDEDCCNAICTKSPGCCFASWNQFCADQAAAEELCACPLGDDCNGNTIPDECDLNCGEKGGPCDVEGCGQSSDCNGSGIPDECEIVSPVLFVDDTAGGADNGSSWDDAIVDLRLALCMAGQNPEMVSEIWVAQGMYVPSELTDPKDPRSATFQLQNNLALYGGFAGFEATLEERVGLFDQTILTGDLNDDDLPIDCEQDSPDCDLFGGHCVDGECIISDNNGENAYHVTIGSGTDATAILDGFTITAGNANGAFPHERGAGMHNLAGNPTVTNCTFGGNSAVFGGGMNNETSSSPGVTNCTFIGNMANGSGGGMHNFESSPSVSNCTFSGNTAIVNGAGMNNFNSSPTVTGCEFSGNTANNAGCGMHNISNSTPTVTGCTFSGNTTTGTGGGMFNNDSSPDVTGCTFSDNLAASGGGMYNFISSNPTVTDCTFNANTAVSNGGGMNNNNDSSPVVTGCIFAENQASHGAGMFNAVSSAPTVTNCVFTANMASSVDNQGRGGGMNNDSSNPIVTGCIFTANTSEVDGGGLRNATSSPVVSDCTFADNLSGNGAGMFNWDGSKPTVTNCTFTGNTAASGDPTESNGGGMDNRNLSSPTVTDCTFSGNNAGNTGGGMRNQDSSATVINCTFIGNTAEDDGGGMRNEDSSPSLTGCTFSGNSATFGGGMHNESSSSPDVTNCTFIGNAATTFAGGGMRNRNSSSPHVTNCTFTGNSAATFGGGMASLTLSNPTVTNCTFTGNTAEDDGGGMRNEDNSTSVIANSILWGNTDTDGTNMEESAQISLDGTSNATVDFSDIQGLTGALGGLGNLGFDPLFVDPDGPDNAVGTLDDDLRLSSGSPVIDAGSNTAVPADTLDLDEDGDTGEPIPLDLDGEARFVDDVLAPDCPQADKDPKVDCGIAPIVDMGAYELGSDCNDNGVPDECDLACGEKGGPCDVEDCGLESDCNGNGAPDVCELKGNDCNGNGVPDECDIAGGSSDDCNANGVPDECELPESCPEGICTDGCDADCNTNCVIDSCDVDPDDPDGDGDVSEDCNANIVPDECEIPPIGPMEGDCNNNGIPDDCDITNCTTDSPDFPACDDCNLNGIPDSCDINSGESQDIDPADGVPDECVQVIEGDANWTDDIWDLNAQYPDNEEGNPDAVPDLHVTMGGEGTVVFLDETVATDTLRIRNGATMEVTQTEIGDFTLEDPGGLLVEGTLLVANDRVIDVTAGAATIGLGGVYQADPAAKGPVSAVLEAGTITVQGGTPDQIGGVVELTGSMELISSGDLLLQTDQDDDDKGGCKGSGTPPDFNSADSAEVGVMGNFTLGQCAEVDMNSTAPVILEGDMENQSTLPFGFNWDAGGLQMNGTSQTIEAAGEDRGPWPSGLEDNFVIGTLTLAANAVVQVVDEFDNQQDGLIECDEALYIHTLVVGAGAVLLTDGCFVYYNELTNDGVVPGLGVDVLQIREPIPADINGDGVVDAFDLALLLGDWGPCPEPCTPGEPGNTCDADFDNDCLVSAFDLAILLGSWGPVR